MRAWKKKGDVSRCIPEFSEHLPRLFRFAEHVVKLATGCAFPTEGLAQIAFIAAHLPALPRDATREPESSNALDPEDADIVGAPRVAEADPIAEDFDVVRVDPATLAAGVAAAPVHADAVHRAVPADVTTVTPAAATGINEGLAARVTVLLQQVAVLIALLAAVAVSCASARAAFIAAWGSQGDKVGCLPQAVLELDAAVRAPQPSRKMPTAPRTNTTGPLGGPAAVADAAAAAPVVADAGASVADSNVGLPDVPTGLSPRDAYFLVSARIRAY